MASGVKASTSGFGPLNENAMSAAEEQAARERLKQLGNRKAISSEDFENKDALSAELQYKMQELKANGATQISSDMMFGRASGPEKPTSSLYETFESTFKGRTSENSLGSGGSYGEYKEAATRVAGQMYEKSSQLKSTAMDWFSQFT